MGWGMVGIVVVAVVWYVYKKRSLERILGSVYDNPKEYEGKSLRELKSAFKSSTIGNLPQFVPPPSLEPQPSLSTPPQSPLSQTGTERIPTSLSSPSEADISQHVDDVISLTPHSRTPSPPPLASLLEQPSSQPQLENAPSQPESQHLLSQPPLSALPFSAPPPPQPQPSLLTPPDPVISKPTASPSLPMSPKPESESEPAVESPKHQDKSKPAPERIPTSLSSPSEADISQHVDMLEELKEELAKSPASHTPLKAKTHVIPTSVVSPP
ncbi:MAG: hypothetical protein LE168_04425, partial [Endomicrobium sp.]|nr:hypothetical protein [Endomicrobium sp.]